MLKRTCVALCFCLAGTASAASQEKDDFDKHSDKNLAKMAKLPMGSEDSCLTGDTLGALLNRDGLPFYERKGTEALCKLSGYIRISELSKIGWIVVSTTPEGSDTRNLIRKAR